MFLDDRAFSLAWFLGEIKGRQIDILWDNGFLPIHEKLRRCPYGCFRSKMVIPKDVR
jgi:hypothetical protein